MKQWGDKRYYSLDYYIKITFGEKLYKLSLDGGMTCPNRDGKIGHRGCIFCSSGGSGDFAGDRRLSIREQINQAKLLVDRKHTGSSYIAYFQAYTNTYAPVNYLEKIFTEAINEPHVRILSIATRPDCLSPEVLELLSRLNKIKPVWVELGLQTIHKESAAFIRRGYDLDVFEKAVYDLKNIGIAVITHVILCLPNESTEKMLETIFYLNKLPIDGIKLQLLHILKGTDLENVYMADPFYLPDLEEYVKLLGDIISHLREDIVIHRLTGDGPKTLLIAPLWTGNKRMVLNRIQKYFKDADIWQGKEISCQNHLHSTN
ncbi:MAG: TIGR01212 family radical SAM protein [Tyzzerella sp.]|nr:TIGR01212 family radical SAM protein [Tyzzerella sp.]